MRLNLRPILHVPGASLPFDFSLDLSELDFYGERPFAHPVRVSGSVRNMADALLLEGAAETVLELVCDRCLKPFRQDNGEVDLDEVFTTAAVLAMDVKHVCSEDCKGLCPTCGADLNQGPCGCRPEPDPRFAALAQLLDKD